MGNGSSLSNKPTLLIMVGLIGTGKTTLAQALSERRGAVYLSSDIIRKRLAGIPETEHRYEEYDEGIYSPDFTDKTYDAMLKEADGILSGGKSVILDASFMVKEWRLWAETLAETVGADFFAVECGLDEKILKERLANRKDTASDGRWEIYLEQKKVFEPVVEIPPEEHIVVDTARPIGDIIGEILAKLGGEKRQ